MLHWLNWFNGYEQNVQLHHESAVTLVKTVVKTGSVSVNKMLAFQSPNSQLMYLMA